MISPVYLDGVQRFSLILNLAVGNDGHELDWTNEPVMAFRASAFSSSCVPRRTGEWDYVRVGQPAGAINVCTPRACS